MNDKTAGGIHWSFWAIGVIALVWNILGVVNFLVQINADMLASFSETARAIIEGRPVWATGGFAIAVFGGTLGCLLLLFRKSIAYYALIASLLGTIVTMIHTAGVASSSVDFTPSEIFMMILMPLLVAALLIWYSKQVELRGWIS